MDYIKLDCLGTSLVIRAAIGAPPSILYWGPSLDHKMDPHTLQALAGQQGGPGASDVFIAGSMAMEASLGLLGPNGVVVHREGRDWDTRFDVVSHQHEGFRVTVTCMDSSTLVGLVYHIALDPSSGVLSFASQLTNYGEKSLEVNECATAVLPIPSHMTDLIGFSGRWAMEFQTERIKRFAGTYLRENRRGRTSHDHFPAVFLASASTTEMQGEVYGLHLGWSGNHRLRVDSLHDGRVFTGLGALLGPGEIRLEPGQSFEAPTIYAAYSNKGLSGISQRFHHLVRHTIVRKEVWKKPRPVHYNTWEAVYFDHDFDKLKGLADRAAHLGVERFVLDDGWFGSRRDDTSGLGDWFVSPEIYPKGLGPLISHVKGLGMEMGIWFEPEMVNPNSDLYRRHPDWVLQSLGHEQIPFRNQLVLDISRPEVSNYLYECLHQLLSHHAISYIKWDMNRDLNHPGDHRGYQRSHAQVLALYALLERLRKAHPHVEIESCASGGGRVDYGILAHTDRVWTSDSNDALDRQVIQRGASYFMPLEVLGAHVGPKHCHITGRTLSMAMRAGTALFGHMGLELNLLTEPQGELEELKAAIALYKRYRGLLHHGHLVRLETPVEIVAMGVISHDQHEALFSVALMTGFNERLAPRIFFAGLDPDKNYRLTLIWPQHMRRWSRGSILDTLDLTGAGARLSGKTLQEVGLGLPLTNPEQVLVFHLQGEGAV
ncbi:alpha-galactosidase [Candidatus Phycosocius spiralis]|uniref:alpha-galactosidase n=1 Tax=Candidatus Phycosocius spiralis TaxID=2815099 RepID=A0ABQ4PU10_9PROT|nr:alpha-galactosidase [Candidatus Phycosocius spiralis]GIU66466.1 alpha-galactosidase [Candidatus Phycosocius spiralis]